jgi:hypothetical protein
MFSLAQEQRSKGISIPPRDVFSRIREKERVCTSAFQSYVAAAAEYGPKLKMLSSLVTALDSQTQSYQKQLKQMKKKLLKVPGFAFEGPPPLASNVSSQPAKTSPQSLTPKQLQEVRDKFIYDFKYIQNPKHFFRPTTPRNGPSLHGDVESKRRKSQKLSIKESALKQEIVTLARSLENTAVDKNSSTIRLNAISHHVSEAISSEYSKNLGAVNASVNVNAYSSTQFERC